MAEYDLVIKGGTVIDGLQTPRYVADVGIKDGVIKYIGKIAAHEGVKVLDATGLIVAPGFVDLHTHYDAQIFWDPWCTISGYHGVTTVVTGNCGLGFAPVRPSDRERSMLTMSRTEAIPIETMRIGIPWDWETFPQFLDSVERTPKGVNVASFVPLNPLLVYTMGIDAARTRRPTATELSSVCTLLDEAVSAGGCGFSTQVEGLEGLNRDYDGSPMPSDRLEEPDLLAVAEVLAKRKTGFIQLTGAKVTPAVAEKVAEVSGRPLIWNFIQTRTEAYKGTIKWINAANARGHRVFGQAITVAMPVEFNLADMNLFDDIECWREVTLGNREERLRKMQDPQRRAVLRERYEAGEAPGEKTGVGSKLPQWVIEIVDSNDLKQKYEGFTVGEVAQRDSKHVIDAFLDVAVQDNLNTTFGAPAYQANMAAMKEIATFPFSVPGVSDGGAHTKFVTHGAYPTEFLQVLVRENKLLELEQAHWRLSAYPAMAAGLVDRGYLKEGAAADVVVYDFEKVRTLKPHRAFDYPGNQWRLSREAEGYRWTIVNGEVTFEDGKCTKATPGSLLRNGRARDNGARA